MIRPQFLTLFAYSLIVLQFLSLITHMQFAHHLLSPNTQNMNSLSYVQKKLHLQNFTAFDH